MPRNNWIPAICGLEGLYSTVILLSALLTFVGSSAGQQPITFQYFYDELGQLVKVVDSTGTILDYVYDPVGNMLEIKRSRSAPGALTVFNVLPTQGGPGTTVTIQGQGFSTTASQNTVQFNGIAATVVSATATTLIVTIPPGATSGVVSVTVGSSTATSSNPFTILPTPAVLSVTPRYAMGNATIPNVQITGTNLAGATFSFLPALNPPAIMVNSASVSPDGTSAVLSLTFNTTLDARFTVVATNSAGSSAAFPNSGNTIGVIGNPNGDPDGDGLPNALEILLGTDPFNADTDGDGFPDGVEVVAGSDPLDPNSTPLTGSKSGEVETPLFSVLNQAGQSGSPRETESVLFSVINQAGSNGSPGETESVVFSVLNQAGQSGSPRETESVLFSVLNQAGLSGSPRETESVLFSVLNQAGLSGSPPEVESVIFAVHNGPVSSAAQLSTPRNISLSIPQLAALSSRFHLDQGVVEQMWVNGTDSDGDGLSDDIERMLGTNPFDPDTDHDGYPDGLELALGSNPLDPDSVPAFQYPSETSSQIFSVGNEAVFPIIGNSKQQIKGETHVADQFPSKNSMAQVAHLISPTRDAHRLSRDSARTRAGNIR